MILSPVQIKTDEGKTIDGVLLDRDEIAKVVSLIDRTNADGLSGEDALLLMKLKDSLRDIGSSTEA